MNCLPHSAPLPELKYRINTALLQSSLHFELTLRYTWTQTVDWRHTCPFVTRQSEVINNNIITFQTFHTPQRHPKSAWQWTILPVSSRATCNPSHFTSVPGVAESPRNIPNAFGTDTADNPRKLHWTVYWFSLCPPVSHSLCNAPIFFFLCRCYNFRAVLAFSTNSFNLGRFLMQSLQFVIPSFTVSLFTSSSHLFLGLPSDLVIAGDHSYTFFTMLLSGIRCTCPKQANLCALMKFMMFLLPVSLFSSSFVLHRHVPSLSLVAPYILLNTLLSNTLNLVFRFSFSTHVSQMQCPHTNKSDRRLKNK